MFEWGKMSISSIAEESALRLTPPAAAAPSVADVAAAAAATTAAALAGGATQADAIQQGQQVAAPADTGGVGPSPLAQLVKYIPTETITLYVAVQAALGDLVAPKGKSIADADFASRWTWMWIMFAITAVLTTALSYRSQKNANESAPFRVPYFDVLAAGAAFLVWALSLPSTPLRDFSGYNYNAWDTVIILGGTVAIATAAYVLGKNVSWQKVVDS
jgi:uncharacterized membrane protein